MNNMIVLTSFYGKIEEKFQWIYSDYFACIFFALFIRYNERKKYHNNNGNNKNFGRFSDKAKTTMGIKDMDALSKTIKRKL